MAEYSRASTFSNTFKKYTGSSVKQYKNEISNIYDSIKEYVVMK